MDITLTVVFVVFQIGFVVDVKHPESGQYASATLNKIADSSMYTVGKYRQIWDM